jgi:spermidine synthase
VIGSSVYSFTLVLATFLVGISAGAALVVPWIARRGASWRLFAVLQWMAAVGILYASVRIADAPWSLLANVVVANGRVQWLWVQESLLLAGFMLPACVAFGAIFPVATRLSALPGDTPSHTTGRAYGWNTLGTITGSLLAGFLLMRVIGMRGTLLAVAGTALVIGCIAWFVAPGRPKRRSSIPEGAPIATLAVPALVLGSFAVAAIFAPPWNRGLLAIGVFRPLIAGNVEQSMTPAAARQSLRDLMAMEELLSFVEGGSATVSVHRTKSEPPIFAIRVNGKTDASTSLDMKTQILAGHLPMMWAPDSARVAVVGYGTGVTVGSALTHPLRSLDCIEIEPAVLAADRFFRPYNNDPMSDPRLRLHVEDGRTFITRSRQPYDVIISEPSNPWLAGVNNLFTVDYYRRVEKALAPDGVFCQWMQFYEMSSETLASLLKSLHEVFPEAQVFLSNRDLLLVATRDGRTLDVAHVAERLARPGVARDLTRAEVTTVADLVALRLSDLPGLLPRLPAAPLNLDDRPFVEYRAPVDFYTVRPSEMPFSEQAVRSTDPVAELARWTSGGGQVDLAVEVTHALMSSGNLARANVWLAALLAKDPNRAGPLTVALAEAARRRDRDLQVTQARQAIEADDRITARRLLDAILREHPEDGTALVERARVSMREESLAAARRLLERADRVGNDDERYQAALNLGILEMREGRPEEGLSRFGQAASLRPAELNGWLYQARALAGLGRANEAILLLGRAQATVADSTALRAAVTQLSTTGTLQ